MLSLEEARTRVLTQIAAGPTETVALASSVGRVSAAEVSATMDLPVFDNSAMDGYALQSEDVKQANADHRIALRPIGKIAAGERSDVEVKAGTCVRVFTGSPMPRGADAVVMQEDTSTQADSVLIADGIKPWENVRFRGEDVKQGTTILRRGDMIRSAMIGLVGAMGIADVSVYRQPEVAILATGTELQETGTTLSPGRIYESNRGMLAALVASCGGKPFMEPIVSDTLQDVKAALLRAFEKHDVIVTSGGVSVGEFDYVKEAFGAIGGKVELWRVAIKPGKPFVFGQLGTKFLFGLPGNPVSAFVTFLLLARPALRRLQGAAELDLPSHPARLGEDLENRGDRRHFMRVRVDGAGTVCLAGTQASHVLSSLSGANGLIDMPPGTARQTGSTVQVLRWEL